jgi:ABC-type spermidine/putrescine transport system permease subunit I
LVLRFAPLSTPELQGGCARGFLVALGSVVPDLLGKAHHVNLFVSVIF